MTLWNSKDAVDATKGTSAKFWEADGVSIDSRKIEKGDLFIAIIGENMDGHKFVRSALENGAAAAMVNFIPEDVPEDSPLLIVEDTFEALWDLARFSRSRMSGKVLMVTGSVGKTSTKEMLAHALEHQGKVHATIGNLNNHYGLPLTMCRMPADTDYAVLEVGMSSAGEISPLSVLARPDAAIITTVEAVHLEFFDSVDGIADAKSEVFDGLKEDGIAVLNRDNAYYLRCKQNAISKDVKNIVSFGKGAGAEYELVSYSDLPEGSEVKANIKGEEIGYKLGIAGEHQALNSLGVLAMIDYVGADVKKAAKSFSNFEAKAGRGKRLSVHGSFGKVTIIDDTYNASPASVTASLKVLGNIKKSSGNRVVAVLGDMFELGYKAEELHAGLAKKLVENNIDLVFTAGKLAENIYNNLPDKLRGGCGKTSSDLSKILLNKLNNKDIVLVKGSRGMRMENVISYITEEGKLMDAV